MNRFLEEDLHVEFVMRGVEYDAWYTRNARMTTVTLAAGQQRVILEQETDDGVDIFTWYSENLDKWEIFIENWLWTLNEAMDYLDSDCLLILRYILDNLDVMAEEDMAE